MNELEYRQQTLGAILLFYLCCCMPWHFKFFSLPQHQCRGSGSRPVWEYLTSPCHALAPRQPDQACQSLHSQGQDLQVRKVDREPRREFLPKFFSSASHEIATGNKCCPCWSLRGFVHTSICPNNQ